MATTSNSYAEKVFSEHPIALWSLDEQVDYVSLLRESERDITFGFADWLYDGVSYTDEYVLNDVPAVFPDSIINEIITDNGTIGEVKTASLLSPVIADFSDIDNTKDTFSISTYLYPFSKNIGFEIGYQYTMPGSSTAIPVLKSFSGLALDSWSFISDTFQVPQEFENLQLIFRVTYAVAETDEDYSFLLHGMTVGQWSEQFHISSLGVEPVSLPSDILTSGVGIPAAAYGLQDRDGYYMVNNNSLCATNSDIPLVYGASYSTKLTPNEAGDPSLILPGMGFMNADGQYTDLTLEMWLKIQSSTTTPKRIIGPVSSEDGLYVNKSFMILRVGNLSSSYFISEWDRPMLVAIRLSSTSASLTLNGEEVISISFNPEDVSFPDKFVTVSGVEKNQDFIGFYTYLDVPCIDIDSIGIYPYLVPNIVEKRRWVYGQAVDVKENIAGSDISTTVVLDYPFANYAKNYIYPDMGRFDQGINENLVIDNNEIKLPEYGLPTIAFSNKSVDSWYSDMEYYDNVFGTTMTFKPNASWTDTEAYMVFDQLNFLDQDVKAFYGLFETSASSTTEETLFYIHNDITNETFSITQTGATTSYKFSYLSINGEINTEVVYSDSYHTPGDFLVVGIKFDDFISTFGGKLAQFFGTKQNLKFYVGGSKEFVNTFSGNIYRIGFCTARNLLKISTVYTSSGIAVGYNALESESVADAGNDPENEVWDELFNAGDEYFGNLNTSFEMIVDGGGVYSVLVDKLLKHIASYTLIPKTYLDRYFLDVGVNGYWQDYVPLSYFGKYISEGDSSKYDVDFIQFNVAYPTIEKYINGGYDTSDSIVRTYVSFQDLKEKITIRPDSFNNVIAAPQDGVIDAENYLDVADTKYEVVNDTIIYPPRGSSNIKNLAMLIHVEIVSQGIVETPVKIKSIQLASQALNQFTPNAIGTKYGTSIYPYRRSGGYFDYKGKSPFSIYKGSSPYLYLTGTSGIRLRGFQSDDTTRGLSIPINQDASPYYKVSALQMSIKFDDEVFPAVVKEIFEIASIATSGQETIRKTTKFYIVADGPNQERGVIYAIDFATGMIDDNVLFYINGREVKNPIINLKSWATLGLVFKEPVSFGNNPGALRITGPLMFNNIFQYQISKLDEEARTIFRKWSAVSQPGGEPQWWDYWASGTPFNVDDDIVDPFVWRTVLTLSSAPAPAFDGASIYEKYTGTDRIVIDSNNSFKLNNYSYKFYSDIRWDSTVTISA